MAVALDAMVAEVVAAHADETEAARRLPGVVVDVLRHSGLNRMAIPAALGGTEAPVVDTVEAVAAIAAVDGSTGWCAAIGVGSNVFAGYLPEEGAREVFADPDQGNATMFAPSGIVKVAGASASAGAGASAGSGGSAGPGGSPGGGRAEGASGRVGRLDGRWAFTSNCLHSAWAGLGAIVEHDGTPEPAPRVVFVRLDDLTIEDTWTAEGLRGTGSHHVVANDLEVDLIHSCRFTDRAWPDGPLWRVPIYTVLIPVLAAVPLGIARGAVDEVLRIVREGRVARRGQLHDDPVGLAELAAADCDLRAARAALLEALDEAWQLGERGDPVSHALTARILLAGMRGCDVAVAATSVAHALGGGAAAYGGNRLLRALLDIQTGRQHQLFSHHHRPPLAAALAGRDVTYPPFLV